MATICDNQKLNEKYIEIRNKCENMEAQYQSEMIDKIVNEQTQIDALKLEITAKNERISIVMFVSLFFFKFF